jgi:hypothetical protein
MNPIHVTVAVSVRVCSTGRLSYPPRLHPARSVAAGERPAIATGRQGCESGSRPSRRVPCAGPPGRTTGPAAVFEFPVPSTRSWLRPPTAYGSRRVALSPARRPTGLSRTRNGTTTVRVGLGPVGAGMILAILTRSVETTLVNLSAMPVTRSTQPFQCL